jgi:hypothetical protein
MKKEPTHAVMLRGCDNRTPDGFKQRIKVRELKTYFVDSGGTRYDKKTGFVKGQKWPLYYLDLETLESLNETPK